MSWLRLGLDGSDLVVAQTHGLMCVYAGLATGAWCESSSCASIRRTVSDGDGRYPVTISEASIRSDLLFDDDDGIDTLNNQAIFDTIQLMGNVTPLFHSMLVQPTEDEGEVSERPSKSQPIPSPTHLSKDQPESQPDLYPRPSFSIPIPDSNPEGSGGNHGEASLNEAMDTLAQDEGKTDSKVEEPKTSSKTEELHLSDDTLVVEDKGSVEKGGSTKGFDLQQSTVKPDEGTDKQDESTDSFVEEKTDGNAEFHKIIDFFTQSSIQYALTVSPVVPTTFVEQFWMSAKSKTINNVRYITAIVSGKPVTILEASIRSDLLFDDADRIDILNNQAIFDTIQLMGNHCISSKSTSWDQIPTNISTAVTLKAKEIKDLKAQIKQRKKKARPVITHHKAWMKSVSMKTRLARKKSMKKKWMQKEFVSKQGRKTAKSEPTVHKDQAFDDLDELDAMDYTETEDAHNEERTSLKTEELKTSSKTKELNLSRDTVVLEEKESVEKGVSTKDQVSTVKADEGTDKPKVSTDKIDEGTTEPKDEVLTLKPLPKIDPKAKGKGMIKEEDESNTESEDITKAEKKFKMLANDEEIARKVQEEWEAKEEKERLAEEEATKAAFTNEYDFIQARLNADKILTEKLQEEEREKVTIEERAKLLHDTIAAQRIFLA
ncbi:hypothetical protein Tco_0535888 [Tanacetum coccineum]